MILYGSLLCPDCPTAIKHLRQEGIEFEFRNINENIDYLRRFLALRDNRFEFNHKKTQGKVGIPCVVFEDGSLAFFDEIMKMKHD